MTSRRFVLVFGIALGLVIAAGCSRDPAPSSATASAKTEDGSCFAPSAKSVLQLEDVSATCGVDFVHDCGATPEKHLPETMGAGAAIFDADEDGDLDLYFVQSGALPQPGGAPDRFTIRPGSDRSTNQLFLNDGRAHFTDATKQSGDGAQAHYGMGVAVGDADGDGHEDLYLTNLGDDVLLRGDGKASFRDVTAQSGISDPGWSTGAAFFDADDDGDLDLFVTSYVVVDLANPVWCGERKEGWRSYCHPDAFPGGEDHFWSNRGDGTFEDRTKAAGFSDPNGKGLCVLASDLDGDGHVDLYVANDSTENRLYKGRGDGTFQDATLLSGTGVDRYGRTEASMGVASGDVDGDGDLDLFVTGFDDESDTLYVNQGDMVFEDRTVQAGLELATRLPVGFGCVLEDLDGDTQLDLGIANGHIIDNIALYHDGKTHAQHALLFQGGEKGRFEDVSASEATFARDALVGRGLYAGDLDGDGAPDLVLTQCDGAPRVFRNRSTAPGLVIAGLPHGTRVEVIGVFDSMRYGVREAIAAPSYLGASAREPRFRLRAGDLAHSVRLRAPGGAWQTVKLSPPVQAGRLRFSRGADGRFALVR